MQPSESLPGHQDPDFNGRREVVNSLAECSRPGDGAALTRRLVRGLVCQERERCFHAPADHIGIP
jgi:hypothetical protein